MYKRINQNISKKDYITYEILKSIDFFNRYEKLCKDHIHSNTQLKTLLDSKILQSLIKKNNYSNVLRNGNRSLRNVENFNDSNLFKFYIGGLHYSFCEFQIYFNTIDDLYILGDVGCGLYDLKFNIEKNVFDTPNLPYPKFINYKEFEEIFSAFAKIYEDFKIAVIKSGIKTLEDIESLVE
ncbi:MAG: hypothetical protein ACRCXZ_08240 [Patescibacteria group bacterium]